MLHKCTENESAFKIRDYLKNNTFHKKHTQSNSYNSTNTNSDLSSNKRLFSLKILDLAKY